MRGVFEDNAPDTFNLTLSLTDSTALKAAVATAAGLSSVSLAGPGQSGREALYHFLTGLTCATISGDTPMRGALAAAVKKDSSAGRAMFTAYCLATVRVRNPSLRLLQAIEMLPNCLD